MTKNGKIDTICGRLKIHEITNSDLPEIIKIEKVSFKTPWKLDFFETELQYQDSVCLKATIDEKLVGYIILRNFIDEIHIMNIAVNPDYRNQGIATDLLNHIINVNPPARLIVLEVRKSNVAALNLYKKMGFINLYIRKSYYPDGEDAIVMVKGHISLEGSR